LVIHPVQPNTLVVELPTKYVKDTFVGFVLPQITNEDPTCFFETLLEELKREDKKMKQTNFTERSFQEIFEAVKSTLKDKVAIASTDDFNEKPIYLFSGNNDIRLISSFLLKVLNSRTFAVKLLNTAEAA
jgi:hypothetical protein